MKRLLIMMLMVMAAMSLVACGGEDTPPTLSDPNGVILQESILEENVIEEITVKEIKVNEIEVNEIKIK